MGFSSITGKFTLDDGSEVEFLINRSTESWSQWSPQGVNLSTSGTGDALDALRDAAAEHWGMEPEEVQRQWVEPMTDVDRIQRMKIEILTDIENGVVPPTVRDFSTLHDFVDANYYGGFIDGDPDAPEWDALIEQANRCQDAVHRWLQAGRLTLDDSTDTETKEV